jgi:maltooligosyltrehalose trehalohydrolase
MGSSTKQRNHSADLFGPTAHAGGVTFRAWSPRARRMRVVLHPGSRQERRVEMRPCDDGYFVVECDEVGAGCRYLLQRDDKPPQPDPAAAFQPDGIWGPSEVIDHRYDWTDQQWRGIPSEEMVLYEVHVGAFTPEGTYQGLRERLDRLVDLGVNTLKLMPLATFPGQRNWGYDGVFHLAPFHGYGRPDSLRALIDACHAKGLGVLLDLVTNHFGPEGNAMWTLSRSFFARHNSTPWGPGPRFDHSAVLSYFAQVARCYRRDYHFDGLRIDAFDAIPREHRRAHLEQMVEAFSAELAPDARGMILLESVDNELSLLHSAETGVSVTQLCFDFQRSAHRLLTGETHRGYSDYREPAHELVRCAENGFSMLQRLSARRQRMLGEPPRPVPWATVVNYLQNHDTAGNRYRGERLEQLIEQRRWRAALAYLLLQPGIPYLLMGSEWATRRPFLFFTDFSPDLGRRIARSRRRDFDEVDLRTLAEHPPDPQDPKALALSTLDWQEPNHPDHAHCLAYTRKLIALRQQLRPSMAALTSNVSATAQGQLIKLSIAAAGEGEYCLVANFDRSEEQLPCAAEVLFASDPLGPERTLPPDTTVLLRR